MNDEFKKFQAYLGTLSVEDRQVLSEQLVDRMLHVAHWASEVMIAETTCCQRSGTCASCELRDYLGILKDRMAVHL